MHRAYYFFLYFFLAKMKTKKQQIKQQIAATVVISFMLFMVFGTLNTQIASALGTNPTLIQNIVAGTLQLETQASLGFATAFTTGVAGNSTANLTVVNMRDYRGTGAGWTIAASMNNMYMGVAAGTNNISNANISWYPGTINSPDGSSTAGITAGTSGVFSAAKSLASSTSSNGMGNFNVANTLINITYNGNPTQLWGTYQNVLLVTIS